MAQYKHTYIHTQIQDGANKIKSTEIPFKGDLVYYLEHTLENSIVAFITYVCTFTYTLLFI